MQFGTEILLAIGASVVDKLMYFLISVATSNSLKIAT